MNSVLQNPVPRAVAPAPPAAQAARDQPQTPEFFIAEYDMRGPARCRARRLWKCTHIFAISKIQSLICRSQKSQKGRFGGWMDEGRGKKSAIQNTTFGGWYSMRRERKGKNFGRSIWKAAESRCRCPRERQEVLPISNLSSPYVESERARAPGDQPPRDHSRGRLLVKACRRGCGEWGCDIHFDTWLRFGTAEFHATSPKLESDSAGNETFSHARPSPSNPFLCGGPPCTRACSG